jgi:hypothetical protein
VARLWRKICGERIDSANRLLVQIEALAGRYGIQQVPDDLIALSN